MVSTDSKRETTAIRKGHELDIASLGAYLKQNLKNFGFPLLSVNQFKSGQSNPTFLLEGLFESARNLSNPTDSNGKKYVLRKKPPGKLLKSAHMVS